MAMLLHINACARPRGQSRSIRVGDAFVEGWRSAHPGGETLEQALFSLDLPMKDALDANARLHRAGGALEGEEKARFERFCVWIEPLKRADVVLITTPMWNFGPPWKLKQWIDVVTQAKVTFEYTAQGPRGLLSATAALVGSSGGKYGEGDPRQTHDFLKPAMSWALEWMGIRLVGSVFAEAIDADKGKTEEVLKAAEEKARALGRSM